MNVIQPSDEMRGKLAFVQGMLVEVICHARNWGEIEDAATAIFHARLMAKGMIEELEQFHDNLTSGTCWPAVISK